MALSEDALAIVAANLTVAHCVVGKGLSPTKDGADSMRIVTEVFKTYLTQIRKDVASHDPTPPG